MKRQAKKNVSRETYRDRNKYTIRKRKVMFHVKNQDN